MCRDRTCKFIRIDIDNLVLFKIKILDESYQFTSTNVYLPSSSAGFDRCFHKFPLEPNQDQYINGNFIFKLSKKLN